MTGGDLRHMKRDISRWVQCYFAATEHACCVNGNADTPKR